MLLWCHVMLLYLEKSTGQLPLFAASDTKYFGTPCRLYVTPHAISYCWGPGTNVVQYMVGSHFGIQEENSLIIGDLGCPLNTVQEEKYLWVLISEDASSLPESPWSLTLTCRGGTVDPFVFVIITIIITDVTNIAFEGSV